MENKTIAVWGSPGSGKTITAVKMAAALAEQKQNVVIVGCDSRVPLIPLLLPDVQNAPSLGELLAADRFSQIDVLRHCVPCGKSPYISLLGYCRGENMMSYPEYGFQQAADFFRDLQGFDDDFILVDCSSDLRDFLTAAALKQAGVAFRIVNADPKSLLYFQSAAPFLRHSPEYRYDGQINILNNVLPSQAAETAEEGVGEILYALPNVPELKEQYDSACLPDPVLGKAARQYTMGIRRIVKEAVTGEPEHGFIQQCKADSHIS